LYNVPDYMYQELFLLFLIHSTVRYDMLQRKDRCRNFWNLLDYCWYNLKIKLMKILPVIYECVKLSWKKIMITCYSDNIILSGNMFSDNMMFFQVITCFQIPCYLIANFYQFFALCYLKMFSDNMLPDKILWSINQILL
jgi:hypothetical protein